MKGAERYNVNRQEWTGTTAGCGWGPGWTAFKLAAERRSEAKIYGYNFCCDTRARANKDQGKSMDTVNERPIRRQLKKR